MIKSIISKYAMQGMAAVLIVLLVAIGGLSIHVSQLENKNTDLVESNGKLLQANSQLVQDVQDQQATIKGLQDQIEINDNIISENAADKAAFTNENTKLKSELEKLKNEKPEIREYLNQHKPVAIVSMLKSLENTESDKDGSVHSPTASQLDTEDSEAYSGLPDERMWRSANNRLRYSPELMQC